MLAYGNGRSYGDVCLNEGGELLTTRGLDRFISFDRGTGILRCEAGVLLADILRLVVPQGWFLSVTPGTQFVTVGGAIANDVHGKNHHQAGSFGCHVRAFELLRSDGARLLCSSTQNAQWFAATIGGLGLTGLMSWAEIQLAPITNPFLWTSTKRFGSLDEFWQINAEAEARYPYAVSWIDCLAQGDALGRGVLFAGEHAGVQDQLPSLQQRELRVPFDPPISLINRVSLTAFNLLYYHRPLITEPQLTHYSPFFYPLDSILEWNRIYGRTGFFQYQCVLPAESSRDSLKALLREIGRGREGSFLAVMKTFGKVRSPGMLSFPRVGATLALDFPNRGAKTLALFERLDAVVAEAGGALYPAKDARMKPAMFRQGFPAWEAFSNFVDPHFSSSFWRRVTEK
jgi:FAD/FMN-containing dehydrogenase